jgi:hypothetical protein
MNGFTALCFARMINVPYVDMSIVLSHTSVIDMIEKHRLKWLGHTTKMNSTRNPHQCPTILDIFKNGFRRDTVINKIPN